MVMLIIGPEVDRASHRSKGAIIRRLNDQGHGDPSLMGNNTPVARGVCLHWASAYGLCASSCDKVIVITGASSGFGKGVAQRLAAQGAHVVLAARQLKRKVRQLGCGGIIWPAMWLADSPGTFSF